MRGMTPPRRPSPALILAFVALLAALSGSAVALPGKGSVDSGDLKRAAVHRSDLAAGAVTGRKVRDDSLTGADLDERTLAGVPLADRAGQADSAARADAAGRADVADTARKADRSAIADAVAAPEPYHVVGAPGEPPFLNGCERRHLSLPGVDADLAAPAFYKDREGVVHFRGSLECPAAGATVFKLPKGYRPAPGEVLLFPAACLNGCYDAPGHDAERADIVFVGGAGDIPGLDGAVQSSGTVMSLDGMTFRAEG
jgi:hypothetical protein